MILFTGVIAISVVVGYLFGGRIRRFEQLRLRWWALAPIGLALQAVPLPDGGAGADLVIRTAVLSASYVLILVFAGVNIRVPGMPLVLAGVAMNFVVIAVNGGMPVSRDALERSGQAEVLEMLLPDQGAKHHLLTADDRLTFLADIIPVGWFIRQAVSVGDVFMYGGLAWLIVAVMLRRTTATAPPTEAVRYRGKHRRGRAVPAPSPPAAAPPAATT